MKYEQRHRYLRLKSTRIIFHKKLFFTQNRYFRRKLLIIVAFKLNAIRFTAPSVI